MCIRDRIQSMLTWKLAKDVMKDKKKAERRYQEYLKKMNKKKGEQKK